jgi:hypothetical protein
MLNQFVNIINSSNVKIEGDYLSIIDHIVDNLECLRLLDTKKCIYSIIKNGDVIQYDDLNIDDVVNIDFSLYHLTSIGYYENFDELIKKHKYSAPSQPYYIRDVNCFNTDNNQVIDSYLTIISFTKVAEKIAKHYYDESNIYYFFIFQENNGLLLPCEYDSNNIKQIKTDDLGILKEVINILDVKNTDKKQQLIFINQLIESLNPKKENNRFKFLLSNISNFFEKANNAYQYYIRDFSYNKLKTELNNTALEYSKKIQSVINEAQTKLITIPTAAVLAVINMKFSDIFYIGNIGIISSLFIFAVLIELFIKNQKSTLVFIKHNIDIYKESFKKVDEKILKESFEIVDKELKKQKTGIVVIRIVTWIIPISLLVALIISYLSQNPTIWEIQWENWICQK